MTTARMFAFIATGVGIGLLLGAAIFGGSDAPPRRSLVPRVPSVPPLPKSVVAYELPYPVPPEPESSKPRRSRDVLRSELDAVKAEVKVLQEQVKRISQYLNETRHQVEI